MDHVNIRQPRRSETKVERKRKEANKNRLKPLHRKNDQEIGRAERKNLDVVETVKRQRPTTMVEQMAHKRLFTENTRMVCMRPKNVFFT